MRMFLILIVLEFIAAVSQPVPLLSKELRSWNEVKSWGCQLQDLNLKELADSKFDLLVIDYSRDGSDSQRFTRSEIDILKYASNKRRLVLSYLSIGEAENYRYYWKESWNQKKPQWLDDENPNWRGNYKVHYWDPEWQGIILDYLDKIIAAGFDGVYLDIIDAYEYYGQEGRSSAADEMKQFVSKIAGHAREVCGEKDFGIFPQNGDGLVEDPQYLSIITGVGREDTYYGYEKENEPTPDEVTINIERFLNTVIKSGKLVLNLDYTTDHGKMAEAYKKAAGHGYLEYCTTRELDQLISQP